MGTRNNRNNRLSHYGQLFCKNSILTLRWQTFFEFQLVTKVLILCCTVKTVASPALFHEPYTVTTVEWPIQKLKYFDSAMCNCAMCI